MTSLNAVLAEAQAAVVPIETITGQAFVGKATLNADRTDGKAVLIVLDAAWPLAALRGALDVGKAALLDVRLAGIREGAGQWPAFFANTLRLPAEIAPKNPRALIVLTAGNADLYAPARTNEKLSATGWPQGARVVMEEGRFFKVTVPWTQDKGFGGILTATLQKLRDATGASTLVNMNETSRDLPVVMLLDTVREMAGLKAEPASWLSQAFPGLACGADPCVGAIPVLFSGVQPPKPAKPEITMKEERPAGFCDKASVAKTITGRSGAYRACYEMELARNPDMEGRIELRFTIEPDGSVSGSSVTDNTLGNKKVEACLVKQISGLKFAKPDGGVCVIRWPFKFQPGG